MNIKLLIVLLSILNQFDTASVQLEPNDVSKLSYLPKRYYQIDKTGKFFDYNICIKNKKT